MSTTSVSILLLAACASVPAVRSSQEPGSPSTREAATRPAIGETAPDFLLKDVDGRERRLSDFRGKIVVLEWTSHLCPAVNGAHDDGTLDAARKKTAGSDVVWLAVDSSHFCEQVAADIRAWRKRRGLAYPCLLDADGRVGRSLGAESTPQVFVIDANGKLVYRGAIDDHRDGSHPKAARSFVVDAVAALRAGKRIATPETRALGCSVKYRAPGLDLAKEAAGYLGAAREFAASGKLSQALEYLKTAVRIGYPTPCDVLSDKTLRPMREDPEARKSIRDLLRGHAVESKATLVDPSEPGEALVARGTVKDTKGQPVAGALVYVFHTDAKGYYSKGGMDESNPRLFGFLRTDASGTFEIRTIRPGHYPSSEEEPVEQHMHGDVSAPGFGTKGFRLGFEDDPFWKQKSRTRPAWAAPVTRASDRTATCTFEVVLQRN